jgi:hypothetical protein
MKRKKQQVSESARLCRKQVSDAGAAKWRHFWRRFRAFLAKNGTKTAKNGPKSGGYVYRSVNYAFLYSVHSL